MKKMFIIFLVALSFFIGTASLHALTISDVPLFVTQSVEPRVLLAMSNDHQLYIKAYTDYSDLNGSGQLDTTYNDAIDYYGYFGVSNCYTYSTTDERFNPTSTASGANSHHCGASEWSGNFLNWATMTRMDVIRKVLYGGYRFLDGTKTVLERVLLPYDVHSFAKVFTTSSTSEMQLYVPYAETEVSICNVTYVTTGVSNVVTEAPHMRIAKGSWPLWASSEVTQCTWGSGGTSAAERVRPKKSDYKLDIHNVRVAVCESGLEEDNCQTYPNGNKKPVGLLQIYSEGTQKAPLRFGLITGSYQKNLSGGVLRRNIEPIVGNAATTQNEIDQDSGVFLNQSPSDVGIINTLNRLRISSYDYKQAKYGASCDSPGITNITDGKCVEWGNPLSEIYLEALRYYSGKTSPTPAFDANDGSYIPSLPRVTWTDPIPSTDWCADCSMVVISTGLNSFDTDGLSNNDLGIDADAETDRVGNYEGLSTTLLVGEGATATDSDKRCTAKTVSGLSDVQGICPEVPSMEGGYHIAGLAYHARTNDLRPNYQGETNLMTYTVALAESLPRFEIPVGSGTVTILPACEANSTGSAGHEHSGWRICSMTDLVVENLTYSGGAIVSGQLLVSWEDSTWGNDYDMDGISRLEFCVGSACKGGVSNDQVQITSSVQQANAGHALRFGYTITGSTEDGMRLPILRPGDKNFSLLAGNSLPSGVTKPTTDLRTVGESAAELLENPLWYTAKYGGFIDQNNNGWPDLTAEWSTNATGVPDTYFKATNPGDLFEALGTVFETVVKTSSSAASVVANSVRLDTGTYVYQARFRTNDWSGELLAYPVQTDGSVDEADWEAGLQLPDHAVRNIYTINASADPRGVSFAWGNLNAMQNATIADNAVDGQAIINYIRGDRSRELQQSGGFRDRERLLGDIINSDPVFVGVANYGYNVETIPEGFAQDPLVEGAYNQFLASIGNRTKMIYLGANDGMLHGFRAEDGVELFAYIPNEVIPKLKDLTLQKYEDSHQYFVDGPPRVGDAYIDVGSGNQWRTILLGSTGAGGKSVFALDITDPDNFDGNNVLWEFTHTDLGYTIGQPTIARLTSGDWVAIFGNGYNSTSNTAKLFIVNLATGGKPGDAQDMTPIILDTGIGDSSSPNGMATPIPVDTDGDRITEYIYAGDVQGNLWKIDVTDSNSSNWLFSFPKNSNDSDYPLPLFTAMYQDDGNVVTQPITVRPVVSAHPDGGYMVYFGTGRFFATGDDNVASVSTFQSFYAIRDLDTDNSHITETDRSTLQEQEIAYEQIVSEIEFNYPIRVTTKNAVNYTDTSSPTDNPVKRGWYIDLIKPTNVLQGERVISPALLRSGRIIFNTLIPSSAPCDFGGKTWLMELDALTGGRLDYSPFDFTGDGIFNKDDFVTVTVTNEEGNTEEMDVPVSGIQLDVGIAKTPAVISAGDKEYKYFSGSSGEMQVVTENPGDAAATGRKSWRQLR